MAQEHPRTAPDDGGSRAPPEGEPGRVRVRSTFEGRVIGAFAVLVAVASLLLGENLVFLMAAVALGLLLATRLLATSNLRGLRVARDVPARARVGRSAPLRYEIQNPRGRGAVGVEVHDRAGATARPVDLSLEFPYVAGRSRRHHITRFVFLRRGRQSLRPVRLRTRFPLGLFEAEATSGSTGEVLVRPREGRATGRLATFVAGRADAHRRSSRVVRGQDAFYGVREYREGDDPRRIHWRTTARTGTLALSEWHRDEGLDVVVVLGRGRGAGGGAARDFERAVSVAATLLRLAHRRRTGASLELGTTGSAPPARPALGLARALDALAGVGAQGGRRPRAALCRLARGGRGRVVVYVAAGEEKGIGARLRAAAGPGGRALLLRADQPAIARWVGGLP